MGIVYNVKLHLVIVGKILLYKNQIKRLTRNLTI